MSKIIAYDKEPVFQITGLKLHSAVIVRKKKRKVTEVFPYNLMTIGKYQLTVLFLSI